MKRACLFAMLTANLSAEKLTYPDSHPKPLSEKIHGIDVSDDYRWLEDLNSKQTAEWVKAQNTVTEGYLNKISGRDQLEKHLTDIWNVTIAQVAPIVPYLLLVIILIVRPMGLLGTRES